MTDPAAFTDEENWTGGFYELAIELGDTDDDRLQKALSALWPAAGIEGCFAARDREPADQPEVPRTLASLTEYGHLRGTVRLLDGTPTVCGCVAVREDDGPDWLDFYLPLGALARTDPRIGGFPFSEESGPASLEWRRPIDDWLAGVAMKIFHTAAFRLALIGFETSGETCAASLGGTVPAERWSGFVLPADGAPHYTPADR